MTHLDYMSPHLGEAIQTGKGLIEVRTGSDSDFSKIAEVLEGLREEQIPYLLRILSAHRTPEDMAEAAQAFPEVLLPPAVRGTIDMNNLRVKFSIAAAGGSAHIAGMTASETQTPIIALPVSSSAMGLIDSSMSMIDMPPGIPNGFVANNKMGVRVSRQLYSLSLGENVDEIGLFSQEDLESLSEDDRKLIEKLGIKFSQDAKVVIVRESVFTKRYIGTDDGNFTVIIPTIDEKYSPVDVVNHLYNGNLHGEGVYMGLQKIGEKGVSYKNAILYAAQILGMFNPDIRKRLDIYRSGLKTEVRTKEGDLFLQQLLSPLKLRLYRSGLWPKSKPITLEKGNEELESLGYELFYKGKNADLYLVPIGENEPLQVLMVRSDRTSVFDIKLDLEIKGKGEIQTQISKLGAKFAQERGFPTCFSDIPENIPASLQQRCQLMELCKPLTMEIDGQEQGLEIIMRNYNTGSLYNKFYQKGIPNPYGLQLPEGMQEWDKFPIPIFTPTTKDAQDTPVNSDLVRQKFPELIVKLENLFAEFTAFMYERGYVVVDTKVEVFINSKGEPVLGDEIFTPESSRFIKREDFEAKRYVSADKQIIRNLGKEFRWEARLEEIQKSNPEAPRYLKVSHEVIPEKRQEVLDGYKDILGAMQS